MRKYSIIIIFVLVAVAVSLFCVSANTDSPAYTVGDMKVEKGESFSVVVSLENNPGIISLKFKVNYDETLLSLDSVEDLGLLRGYNPPAPDITAPYTLRWIDSTAVEDSVAAGELIKLNFTAISSEEADTVIEIIHSESYKFDGSGVEFASAEAKIEIRNKYTVKFLDADGETVVSEQKYFAEESIALPENPAKPSDEENKYIFTAWTPEVAETVTEDATYTASYETVALSDDATIGSLFIEGAEVSPIFDPSVKDYVLTVDHTFSSLDMLLTASSEFAAYTVEGNEILRVGENTVTITVTAEKGNIEVYTILVTKLENPDYTEDKISTLKEISTSCGVLSPSFDPWKTDYILYVENSTEQVKFTCAPSSEKAESFSPEETLVLSGDVTEIKLFCVSESGNRTEYTVKVLKLPAYKDGEIPGFVFPGDIPENGGDSDGTGGDGVGSGTTDKPTEISKTTVIIIVALASVLALASVAGIILLVVSNKKSEKKS